MGSAMEVYGICWAKNEYSAFMVALICIKLKLLHQIWKRGFHDIIFAYNVEDSKSAQGPELLILSTFISPFPGGINLKQSPGKKNNILW